MCWKKLHNEILYPLDLELGVMRIGGVVRGGTQTEVLKIF